MKGGGGGGGVRGARGGGSSLKELFVATRNNFPLILCTASLTQRDNNDEKGDFMGSALIVVNVRYSILLVYYISLLSRYVIFDIDHA